MTDLDTTICPYDGRTLQETYDADEHGVHTFFICDNDHVYRSRHIGFGEWIPDFDEVEV